MKRILLFLAAVASLTACNLDVPAPTQGGSPFPSNPDTETFNLTPPIDLSKMTKTATGTYFMDFEVGTGRQLSLDGRVLISFVGFLKNGTLFTSRDSLSIAMDSVIKGLQDAMPGMKEGGERLIVIPSERGFGPLGAAGVPRNSTLIFDMILWRIDSVTAAQSTSVREKPTFRPSLAASR